MTISAPSTIRNYQKIPPINQYQNDYFAESGTRVCLPCYIDPPVALRKDILNKIRSIANEVIEDASQPSTMSGLTVASYATRLPAIEAYLGMSLENLRNALFQRGGLDVTLCLKLQSITGVEIVSDKDFTAAFKEKQALVKAFSKTYPFDTTAS